MDRSRPNALEWIFSRAAVQGFVVSLLLLLVYIQPGYQILCFLSFTINCVLSSSKQFTCGLILGAQAALIHIQQIVLQNIYSKILVDLQHQSLNERNINCVRREKGSKKG